MNKDRDMFYSFGYNSMPMNVPFQNNMMPNNFPPFNDINNKIMILENQIKKLDQRLSKLENPYSSNFNNEPDNNMYMI